MQRQRMVRPAAASAVQSSFAYYGGKLKVLSTKLNRSKPDVTCQPIPATTAATAATAVTGCFRIVVPSRVGVEQKLHFVCWGFLYIT
jgi:hypothetical protein